MPPTAFLVRLVLPVALLINPFLLVRLWGRRTTWSQLLALTPAASIALNTLVPLLLHALAQPVSQPTLALAHLALLVSLALAHGMARPGLPLDVDRYEMRLIALYACFAVALLPVTCLAGIDTYKWQDLATAVRVEQSIPWLVHPLSLLGFTPRSYPSAQPLVLATVQILGELGVETGYYAVSLLCAAAGIFGAYILGLRVLRKPGSALALAFLYALSPVFVRYNHWATGRGFVLGLLPLFLVVVLNLPRATACIGALVLGVLLALSHKAGLMALPLFIVSAAAGAFPPRHTSVGARAALVIILAILAALVAAPWGAPGVIGLAPGALRAAATRFAVVVPLAAVGVIATEKWFADTTRRRLLFAGFILFPLAHHADMYAALLVLPVLSIAAVDGLEYLRHRYPSHDRLLWGGISVIMLLAAFAVLANRTGTATPRRIRNAASFLEQYDPAGPYRIETPRYRHQFQAYLSGCPRFELEKTGPVHVRLRGPSLTTGTGSVGSRVRQLIAELRKICALTGVRVHWYGRRPIVYVARIDGRGAVPPGYVRLYDQDGVAIFGPDRGPGPGGR